MTTEKMEDVLVPQFSLRKYRVQTSSMSREGEMGGARGDLGLMTTAISAPAGVKETLCSVC